MTTVASTVDERSLGRYWGSGRFGAEDAARLHARLGRNIAARLLGAMQLASQCGSGKTRQAADAAVDSLRKLGPDARAWMLTHPVTSGALREIQDELVAAQVQGRPAELEQWISSRLGDLLRGACLVTGGEAEWEAAEPSVIPGIGIRISGQVPEMVQVRRDGDSLVVSRRSSGPIRVQVAEAKPGQWMAVNGELALPSFTIGGLRVHLDSEDRAFRDRWVREARFGPIEVTVPPADQLPQWARSLEEAARVAEATVPLSASLFGTIVRSVVPIVSPNPEMGCSLSDRDVPGAIMTTIDGPPVLAESLLHEFRHNLLHQVEQAYPLYLPGSPTEARFYSPWRNDPRPLHGILHALFVFLDVCAVHAGVRKAGLGDTAEMHDSAVRLAANVLRIELALREFGAHARTTEFGTGLVEGIAQAVAQFVPLTRELPADAVREAEQQISQHRLAWTVG